MAVLIKPVGMLKQYTEGKAELTVEAGCTAREAMQALGIPPDLVALVMVNDVLQPKEYNLQDGDVCKFIAVIGGG